MHISLPLREGTTNMYCCYVAELLLTECFLYFLHHRGNPVTENILSSSVDDGSFFDYFLSSAPADDNF